MVVSLLIIRSVSGTSTLVPSSGILSLLFKAGLQEKINPGWGEGSILENVTFSGINKGYDCDQRGFEFYHLLGPKRKRFIGNSLLSGLSAGPGTNQEDVMRIECRWGDDPYNIENILVEDFDGTVGLTGMPGFYVSDSDAAKAFITGAECVQHSRGRMLVDQIASTIR